MSSRHSRPSILALQSSRKVHQMVNHWKTIDNNTCDQDNLPVPQIQSPGKRKPLSTITNSPQNSPTNIATPKSSRKRKRNENILDFLEKRTESPSKLKLRRQTFTGSPSTSPIKRQKLSKKKEKAILSPLGRASDRKRVEDDKSSDVKSPKVMVDEQKERNRLQKLREALREIYTTEQTYWKNLLQMQSVFYFGAQSLLPLKDLKSLREVEITMEEREGNVDHFHLRLAAEQITQKMMNILPGMLSDYQEYCKNYEDAHLTLLACDTRESKFHQLLRQTQKEKILNLYDSLILPVQRLPRYQLLLTAVQKYFEISPYHQDIEVVHTLEECIQMIVGMNVAVDKALKASGNEKQMQKISKLFLPEYADFFNPTQREFLKKGNLKGHINAFYKREKVSNSGTAKDYSPCKCEFILVIFNDQIIVAARDNKAGKLNIQHYLGFDSVFLIDTSESLGQISFQLVNPNYGFTFFPRNKSELIAYKSVFKNALSKWTDQNPAVLILRNKVILEEDNESGEWCAKAKHNRYTTLRRPKKNRNSLSLTLPETLPPEHAETKTKKLSKSAGNRKNFSPLRLLSPRRKGKQPKWNTLSFAAREEAPNGQENGEIIQIVPVKTKTILSATNSCNSNLITEQRDKITKFSLSNPHLPSRDDIIQSPVQ